MELFLHSVCGKELRTEAIPKTDTHTESEGFSKDSSNHWKICTICGEILSREAHIAGPAATEESPQTCTVCGYEIAPALTHSHTFDTAWTKDTNYHWHAATCSHSEEISAKAAHTWDNGVITTQPTETAKGVKTYTCTVCKATKTEAVNQLTPATKPDSPNGTTSTTKPSEITKEVQKGENAPSTSIATSEQELKDMILTEEEKQQCKTH